MFCSSRGLSRGLYREPGPVCKPERAFVASQCVLGKVTSMEWALDMFAAFVIRVYRVMYVMFVLPALAMSTWPSSVVSVSVPSGANAAAALSPVPLS